MHLEQQLTPAEVMGFELPDRTRVLQTLFYPQEYTGQKLSEEQEEIMSDITNLLVQYKALIEIRPEDYNHALQIEKQIWEVVTRLLAASDKFIEAIVELSDDIY